MATLQEEMDAAYEATVPETEKATDYPPLHRLYRLLENARKQGDRATYLIVKGRIEALTGVR